MRHALLHYDPTEARRIYEEMGRPRSWVVTHALHRLAGGQFDLVFMVVSPFPTAISRKDMLKYVKTKLTPGTGRIIEI